MSENRIDPDPWTLASLAIGAVAAIGTVVQAATPFIRLKAADTQKIAIRENLRNSLQDCSRAVQQILRFLARQQSNDRHVLAAPFQYGNSPMALSLPDFQEYRRLSDAMIVELGSLRTWSLTAIELDPEIGKELSERVVPDFSAFADRINDWNAGHATFGVVLDDALSLLQQFERAVAGLIDNRN
ncbi:hypothetical protein [Shinella sp.]|uniref:hypothetical protein n=1 Tax=Shinella sp. TaxID=1870904 RepID=UPI0028AA05F9|nr:hypothetical protein [Shinella sp.]